MQLHRRSFLGLLAAGVAAGAAATDGSAAPLPPRLRDANGVVDWSAVRGQFALDPAWIHLSSFFLVSHPRPVRDAIEAWRRRLDANPLLLESALLDPVADHHPLERTKAALAGYLGGRAEDLALVPNTTTGLALVYNGLSLRPGQEVLTTEHDHYSHHESIRRAVEKTGASLRFIALHDMPRGAATTSTAELVARLERAIRPGTRAVGLTWVHSSTGLKLPIAEMARVVARANAGRGAGDRCLLIVDGVHGVGVEDVDVPVLGADFFVAGAHKWLLAPRGTGFIAGRAGAWPKLRPTVPSFDFSDRSIWDAWIHRTAAPPTRASHVSPGGFIAFEHLFAVPDAIAFHHQLGRPQVAARIAELNHILRAGLAAIPGVVVHTPQDPALAAGIVAFEVDGFEPDEVVARLHGRKIVATSSPYAVSFVRLAAGVMNSYADVDVALAAVHSIATGA
ncbi:Selenocysteine lyase/Cysteine desulfurase [Nannocystis exedens]|uniref:Selenocysteine lyase/Cysteine desulfurase n=1 Tax=Nannocystis exedens TaxID=54 RepID=A0A1I1VXB4_9BACT|nr:aminotransferase class V-fold PLP-dependent enzyme [Nannocystis exedens]PCC72924.1 aminotransferase class V [Nannocystis exedens]SFD87485.1 Selenocysteine lyase/Cysteine desulfurase [Nannocystis exedens]